MVRALFIHGAGGGAWEWRIWQRIFQAHGVKTHALELTPPAALQDCCYEDYLQQAKRAFQSAPFDAVLGASLGGLIAAELTCHELITALVLVAPMPKSGMTLKPAIPASPIKLWAHRHELADAAIDLVDVSPFDRQFAQARWRDESLQVLRQAAQGRCFGAVPSAQRLMVLGELDTDVPNDKLETWANEEHFELWRRQASHCGLLFGRAAAGIAFEVLTWLRRGKPVFTPPC